MKLKDLGPFAVFRLGGRVYVKSSGMLQMLDRSGTLFETVRSSPFDPDAEVEPLDLTSPREGQSCLVCFGGGYAPGEYHDHAHGGNKKRCPNGCLVEGKPDQAPVAAKEKVVCECCAQPLLDCEKGVPAGQS